MLYFFDNTCSYLEKIWVVLRITCKLLIKDKLTLCLLYILQLPGAWGMIDGQVSQD